MQKLVVCTLVALLASVSAFHSRGLAQRSIVSAPLASLTRVHPRSLSSLPKSQEHQREFPSFSLQSETVSPLCAATRSVQQPSNGLLETLKIGSLFGLWYVLNIGYNVYNKKVLNMVPNLVYTIALLQLVIGWFYIFPVWTLKIRPAPELTGDEVKSLLPVAVMHTLTHLGAVVSLGAGAVSFTHIVKAAEPAVSAAISAIFLKQFLPWQVYASLVPVMGGVALASAKELSFTWLSFTAAMISNVASAMRGIVGKKTMTKPVGKNMDAANVYGVMTILSTLMVLPVALWLEGSQLLPTWKAIVKAGNAKTLVTQTLLSGFFYYLYNEVAFLALDNVAPVTHAIGNTIKRVVIIVASVVVFRTPMSMQGVIGSTIAILGVLLYSLAKNKFK